MEAVIVYPHQLFTHHPAFKTGRVVYLVEEPLFFTHNPAHVQKLLLHRLSLQQYKATLETTGYEVHYLSISELTTSATVFERIHRDGYHSLHIVDTTDDYLEREISLAEKTYGFDCHRYDSPLFLLTKDEACARYKKSGRFMAKFYKQLRIDRNILMEGTTPVGGAFSFDEDNRKKLPKGISLPNDISFYEDEAVREAKTWLTTFTSERYGEETVWLPYTYEKAHAFLDDFLHARFTDFGPYEDALTTTHTRLFHSTLSPLLNIGLLTPQEVLDAALAYAKTHDTPINSLEGFVRQILGWREFIRAAYEVDGRIMRTKNFFNHTRTLPPGVWTGATGIMPLDLTTDRALKYGYTHHIERLMVAGNFFLLSGIHPDETYRWFMGMYVDAYDWVMVPNVYGMSQFADGGLFATKPYISGASYLKKMSDYPKGDWENLWTALYWNFINTHKEFFDKNHRLSMMPKLLEKMDEATRTTHLALANDYLHSIK
jgi:deoxyribodipyrimidine photolyase-related protein